MRRIGLGVVLGVCLCAPLVSDGQTPGTKIARIGDLSSQSASGGLALRDAFRQGLQAVGYVEGLNVVIEHRWADGNYERLPGMANELVRLNVDVIVSTGGPPAARAAKAATKTLPVVFVSGSVVETGIVSNLARPGGNITGVEVFAEQLDDKRVEVLKEMLPQALCIAVLWNPATPEGERQRSRLLTAAQAVGVKTRFVDAQHPSELQAAFDSITRDHVHALLVSTDPMFGGEAQRIVRWATAARLPTIYFLRLFVDAGGLMSYGADIAASNRRAATYVDKILKGAKLGDLRVEQPTKFELVINAKTAKTLGLTIPQSILVRANEIIQ